MKCLQSFNTKRPKEIWKEIKWRQKERFKSINSNKTLNRSSEKIIRAKYVCKKLLNDCFNHVLQHFAFELLEILNFRIESAYSNHNHSEISRLNFLWTPHAQFCIKTANLRHKNTIKWKADWKRANIEQTNKFANITKNFFHYSLN